MKISQLKNLVVLISNMSLQGNNLLCHIFRGCDMPMIKLNRNMEAYSEPCQTSKMEGFAKIVNGFLAGNYFRKTLHLICLTEL